MTPNRKAFLDMIAASELGPELLAESDDGYNVIVGSTPGHLITFDDYSRHPHRLIDLGHGLESTAAGRYQVLGHFADVYIVQLRLPDFGHDSQDAIGLQMIGECRALDDVDAGNVGAAIAKCAGRWASLPGNSYGQHQNALDSLIAAYEQAGGTLA